MTHASCAVWQDSPSVPSSKYMYMYVVLIYLCTAPIAMATGEGHHTEVGW